MTFIKQYFIYFVHGVVSAFIVFMFVMIYQSKQESKIMKTPIVRGNPEVATEEEKSTIESSEAITPGEPTVRAKKPSFSGKTIYVAIGGDDGDSGDSQETALKTIQKAVDIAQPGEMIYLLPGAYFQDAVSKRSGTVANPIIIKGEKNAIVRGGGNSRIFEINHNYITLEGFTIDGLHGGGGSEKDYRDKLIYIISKTAGKGVTGVKILSLSLKNAGGECIRLRYFASRNEIAYNTITRCGVFDFGFDAGGKNGEGGYIGTAPEQTDDGRSPTSDPDQSNNNHVHHNTIDTQGNECVDIKEGSSGNIIEYNNCTGQKDPESGGMDSRGNKNVFRYNQIKGNRGAGVRLGGDEDSDGIDNDVYGNVIIDNAAGGIKFQRKPQGRICDNKMEGNTGGDAVGSYKKDFKPTDSC